MQWRVPWCLLLLLLLSFQLLLSPALGQPSRPAFSVGSLLFPTTPLKAATHPAAPDCAASAAGDFSDRLTLPQWDPVWTPSSFEDKRQGPYLSLYPRVTQQQVPQHCEPLAWAHHRLLAVVDLTVQLDLNYCHFRAPAYEAPEEVRVACVPLDAVIRSRHLTATSSSSSTSTSYGLRGGSPASTSVSSSSSSSDTAPSCVWVRTLICNTKGLKNTTHPWRGLDCSNFVAWVYNFAFGYYPATAIGEAACHPTFAPGRLLHNLTTAHLDQLLPGDLVFGRQSRRHADRTPSSVRHVALWTSATVDFQDPSSPFYNATLLANIPPAHQHTYIQCMERQRALGRPVWVIADSNFAGPAYRPFCGSYLTNFSHARRILTDSREAWPFISHPDVASWDAAGRSCVSKWALLARHEQHVRHERMRPPPPQQQQQQHVRHPQGSPAAPS